MSYFENDSEIRTALDGEAGRDFVSSLPLISAQYGSDAFAYVLRRQLSTREFLEIEKKLGCEVCILAFGSLGRCEFVPEYSDLDPMIIVTKCSKRTASYDEIRDAVLRPLAMHNYWLLLDDNENIQQGQWGSITNVDLKYPVYNETELIANNDRASQRRWQLLLESRPLYREKEFNDLRLKIVPKQPNQGLKHTEPTRIDFRRLVDTVPEFFSGFENPTFLYKNAFKYWKTRFLREFYTFANMINLLLGAHLEMNQRCLTTEFLSGSIALKMMRGIRFAEEMDKAFASNSELHKHYLGELSKIMEKYDIKEATILKYKGSYRTEAARNLHGMMVSVLHRFTVCWEAIYTTEIRTALESMGTEHNFDATFGSTINNVAHRQMIEDLKSRRKRYRDYMAATAEFLHISFIRGHLWAPPSMAHAYQYALRPFFDKVW